MISIVYVKARFTTAARRDNALARVNLWITNNVAQGDLFVPAQVAPYDAAYKGWGNALTAEMRFRTAAPRDDLWTTLDNFLTNAANTPVESFGERWDQKLDDPNPDADTTRYSYVTKTWT